MKDYFGYKGKVCVVTGASNGMGKATAELLVELGADVYAISRSEIAIPGLKAFIKMDLGRKDSIDETFKKMPAEIDKFFGVAGISGMKNDFNTVFSVNFIANKYITEEYLLKRMKPGGAIAYVTSQGGLEWQEPDAIAEYKGVVETKSWDECMAALNALNKQDAPGPLAYGLSKRAMNYYVAHILAAFAPKKVRVNAILPGSTESGMTDEFAARVGGRENFIKYTGFAGRLAESREIADPLVYLNSDMASFISGVHLVVDFGTSCQMVAGLAQNPYKRKVLS